MAGLVPADHALDGFQALQGHADRLVDAVPVADRYLDSAERDVPHFRSINHPLDQQFGLAADVEPWRTDLLPLAPGRAIGEQFAKIELATTAKGVRQNIEMAFGTGSQSLSGQARAAAQVIAGGRAAKLKATWQDFAEAGRSYDEAAACGVDLPARDEYDRARG